MAQLLVLLFKSANVRLVTSHQLSARSDRIPKASQLWNFLMTIDLQERHHARSAYAHVVCCETPMLWGYCKLEPLD